VAQALPCQDYSGFKNPGVKRVTDIVANYQENGFKTEVMAAAIRSVDECVNLAGVPYMTMAPRIVEELQSSSRIVAAVIESLGMSFCYYLNFDPQVHRKTNHMKILLREEILLGIKCCISKMNLDSN